jgi:hypothetical protein
MKKGDVVEFVDPLPEEKGLKYLLLEDPDGGRVLAEAIVEMVIRPTQILKLSEIRSVTEEQA